jgi:hypothetical protein
MRHGLTLGELGHWFVTRWSSTSTIRSSPCRAGSPTPRPATAGRSKQRSWINPSPNAPNLSMARCYAGTVMLEGTTLSEGRGTTRPLELFGAPDIDAAALLKGCRRWRRLAAGLPAARLLVRADLPQARRQALRRRADPRRRPPHYDHAGLPPLAPAGAGLQGHPPPAARLPAVARFPLRIRTPALAIDLINGARCCASGSTTRRQHLPTSMTRADEDVWEEERKACLLY